MNTSILNRAIFFICNIILLFKEQLIANRNVSLLLTIVCVIGIVYAVYRNDTKPISKVVVIGLYVVYAILYFLLKK